ncbi:hypothetical protein OAG1_16190 [Agarivorans sp. OAG1]|uniref:WbqC family protein n=1 Tax=unclassified Agarivorans TaxID=2636026 RepID=UPI002B2A98E5|nr:hypothetical protein OAG1_16190 [Agarivorans sp. OAG1]
MKTVAILQSNYIPWLGYFYIISQADVFVLYDIVQYTKNDWRNRNRILSSSGPQWLTVPVAHSNLEQAIDSVTIAKPQWAKKHWRSIEQNYRKSPLFEQCHAGFKQIYNQHWERLTDLNQALIREACDCLGISTTIINARELQPNGDRNEKLVDICLKLEASNYLSGPAAKNYIEPQLFHEQQVQLDWVDYSPLAPLCPANSENFSILHTIFNNLGQARQLLAEHSSQKMR